MLVIQLNQVLVVLGLAGVVLAKVAYSSVQNVNVISVIFILKGTFAQ